MSPIETDPKVYGFRADVRPLVPKEGPASRGKKVGAFFALFKAKDDDEALSDAPADGSTEVGNQLDDIHQLGEKLARHQSNETIQAYKKALKKVIEAFVQQGLATTKHSSNRNVLQQKSYQMISVIDETLERLVIGILQSQLSQIEILAKIEEIQGLLVNLLH